MISALILTYNEAINIPPLLASLNWCDDIVIYDSFSTDETVELAKSADVRIFQRRFDNYSAQRNAALTEVTFKHSWVLMLDADERIPAHEMVEIEAAVSNADDEVALFRMRRNDMFFGRNIRRSAGYPTWGARIFRVGRVRVERNINEEFITDGRVELLTAHFDHYPFNKGIAYWFERHNRYSTMEAETLLAERSKPLKLANLFGRDPIERRKTIKQLAYRMPLRPIITFLYLFIVRRGFMEGLPGFTYSILRSTYEFMIDLKIKELRYRANGLQV